jgi:hypothetical protein
LLLQDRNNENAQEKMFIDGEDENEQLFKLILLNT